MPPGPRRRTPGLRRDEVAQLAGIGSSWYTFLEQGRNVRVSAKVLERLTAVFGLNAAERRYLYQLALNTVPDDQQDDPGVAMTDDLRSILARLDPSPAYVLDHRFDMIAWNAAGSFVFGYSDETPLPYRNVIRRLIADPAKRRLHHDYEPHVRNTIAAFRPHFSRHADDPEMLELVAELEETPDFRRWWSQHEVLDSERLQMVLHLNHPVLGEIEGRFTFLSIFGRPNLTLCVFTAEPGSRTEKSIERVITGSKVHAPKRTPH